MYMYDHEPCLISSVWYCETGSLLKTLKMCPQLGGRVLYDGSWKGTYSAGIKKGCQLAVLVGSLECGEAQWLILMSRCRSIDRAWTPLFVWVKGLRGRKRRRWKSQRCLASFSTELRRACTYHLSIALKIPARSILFNKIGSAELRSWTTILLIKDVFLFSFEKSSVFVDLHVLCPINFP